MSQDPQGPGWSSHNHSNIRYGSPSGPGGSVKRARQRVEAGLSPEQAQRIHDPTVGGSATPASKTPHLRLGPNEDSTLPLQGYSQRRRFSRGPKPRLAPSSSGSSASTEAPPSASQRLLRDKDEIPQHHDNSTLGDQIHNKRPPPQRPPRPSYVPSILDASSNPEIIPLYQHHPSQQPLQMQSSTQQSPYHWEGSHILSSNAELEPLGAADTCGSSSRPSMSSSVGSIPEFPTPANPIPHLLQTRRSANLGPPPSSRRGASSYYSQSSYVAPIPEELPEFTQISHGSYASSHVIPAIWNDGPPEHALGEEDDDPNEGEDGRESRGGAHDESTGLVRKASLGKRHKPSLTTIRSSEALNNDGTNRVGSNNDSQAANGNSNKPKLVSRVAVNGGEAKEILATHGGLSMKGNRSTNDKALEGGTSSFDVSSSTNGAMEKAPNMLGNNNPSIATEVRPRSPATFAMDERVRQIMGGLERGGALQSGTPSPAAGTPSGEKVIKRPPRLNIDAVKDAEARGSLTSLPDLIRRATKLASNLDRGRTASRLGMRDMLVAGEATEKDLSPNGRARSGSLTDILASFPPPNFSTPTPTGERGSARWPSPFANSNMAIGQVSSPTKGTSEFTKSKRNRKCCGMPLWGFTFMLIVLVLLIAAAVVIPIALIVLPRQRTTTANAAAATDLSNCRNSTPCANGGTSIVTSDGCSCICVNGFTGALCNQQADSGCVTTNLNVNTQTQSSLNNVTLGSSIPRLISAAQSNFSIPLNSSAILSRFSAANLSCTSENALVTFNSRSQRRNLPFHKLDLMHVFSMPAVATPSLIPRQDASLSATFTFNEASYPSSAAGVYTSNGIILAGATTSIGSFTTPTPLATATTTSAAPPSSTSQTVSQNDFDFARVAVLYIFQETRLDTAVMAQGKLQGLFDGDGFNRSDITVGDEITINFGTGTIRFGNGTFFGGRGGRK